MWPLNFTLYTAMLETYEPLGVETGTRTLHGFPFQAGIYIVNLFEWYSAGFSLMIVSLLEVIAISWIYGKITISLHHWCCPWSISHFFDNNPTLTNFSSQIQFVTELNYHHTYLYSWVFHDRRVCQIIWQIFRQGRTKKIVKNCPQWVLKPEPPDLQANALPTELGRNLLGRRFLKWALFVSCTTSHVRLCLFLESIEYDFMKAMKIQAGNWMLA